MTLLPISRPRASWHNDQMNSLLGPIRQIQTFSDELRRIRQDLHANPELGFEEVRTSALVCEELKKYGVDEIHTGIGKTGVVGVIRGKKSSSGKAIGLRADMDALPMSEDNDFAWKSVKPGLMHGCGHDGHTTMLLGAARFLAASRDFDGTAICIFQPGEEGYAGARAMIQDGLFTRFPVDSVYAMHNWPGLPVGKIGLNPGPMMAAADRIAIKVTGRGGHGAHAYLAVDPVLVAAHIITAIQSIVSRNVSPNDQAVISICAVQAGDLSAMSVIPGQATLVGTVRTFNKTVQDMIERRLKELVPAVATGFGAQAEVTYERIYPATINSIQESQYAMNVAKSLVGQENIIPDLPPSMGAEDFSFMLQQKPGAYLRIGQAGAAGGCFLHNTRYDFNDEILPLGAALYASLATQAMPLTAV
jgi:amidohydrolase